MELLVLPEGNLHTFSGRPDRFPTYWIIKLRPPSRVGREGGLGDGGERKERKDSPLLESLSEKRRGEDSREIRVVE